MRDDLFGDGKVEVTGYRYVDADTGMDVGTVDWRGWLRRNGAVSCYAAGVNYVEGDLLQCDGLQPSRRLALVRDPENPHDANAVSISLEDGRHVGWVPRRDAVAIAARLDLGERLAAAVVDQTRDSSGRRVAYSLLICDPSLLDELFARVRRWTE